LKAFESHGDLGISDFKKPQYNPYTKSSSPPNTDDFCWDEMIPFDYQYHFERHMLIPRTNALGVALIFVGAPLCGESCETEILLEIP
jgi:hypothetical protein